MPGILHSKEMIGKLLVGEVVINRLRSDGMRVKFLKNSACINNVSYVMFTAALHLVLVHVGAHTFSVQHEAGFTCKARQRVGFMVA